MKLISLLMAVIIALGSKINISLFTGDYNFGFFQDSEGEQDSTLFTIALFGLSSEYDASDVNRTDCIMLVTIDHENRQLKFTSILRDTKVTIPGYRSQKINAANRLGGPWLALQTINQNFGLDVQEYITVGFSEFKNIIDYLGGTYVYLTQAEADHLNSKFSGYNLTSGGNSLDGFMTLEYCRIRAIDSDVQRVKRQKNVLRYLVNYASSLGYFGMLSVAPNLAGMVESTSLSMSEILSLASYPIWEYEIVENFVPDTRYEYGVWSGIDDYGEWVWVYDTLAAGERIRNIINYKQ